MLIGVIGISLAAVLIEMIGISFVLPVSECDLTLTSRDKGVLSGIGFVGKITKYCVSFWVVLPPEGVLP